MVTSRSFHALARWVIGICKFQIPSNPSLSTRLIKSRGSTYSTMTERITHDSHFRRAQCSRDRSPSAWNWYGCAALHPCFSCPSVVTPVTFTLIAL